MLTVMRFQSPGLAQHYLFVFCKQFFNCTHSCYRITYAANEHRIILWFKHPAVSRSGQIIVIDFRLTYISRDGTGQNLQ